MQLQIENERTFLTYKYKKVQDIDDVILQLLNEADIEGFAESHMNKAKSTVNYDVTGYRKWSEFSSGGDGLCNGESLSSSCLSGGFVY